MSAKKPRFKPRVGWAVDKSLLGGGWIAAKKRLTAATHSVRVTDARDLTAEQAVQKVLQVRYNLIPQGLKKTQGDRLCEHAKAAGMTARVVNGKVRVRRLRQ